MINKILVPFDMSNYSLAAANEAIELAKLSEGSITFIHVVGPEPYNDELYDSSPADRQVEGEIRETANKWFSQVAEICAKKKVPSKMEVMLERNLIVQTIADYAKNMGADLIIVGHSTAHGFGRLLKGDVAKGVIDHAHALRSVLVVKGQ
jgi:nucleotide-binding universal stress UspA family protein